MSKPTARVGDPQICPLSDGPKPHVGGPLLPPGITTVLVGGVPIAVVGNLASCQSAPATIATGSTSVLCGGRQVARQGDVTSHGGQITGGLFTVLIGD